MRLARLLWSLISIWNFMKLFCQTWLQQLAASPFFLKRHINIWAADPLLLLITVDYWNLIIIPFSQSVRMSRTQPPRALQLLEDLPRGGASCGRFRRQCRSAKQLDHQSAKHITKVVEFFFFVGVGLSPCNDPHFENYKPRRFSHAISEA